MHEYRSTPAAGSKESRAISGAVHFHTSNHPNIKVPTWTPHVCDWLEFIALLDENAKRESPAAPRQVIVPANLMGGTRLKNAVSEINVALIEVVGVALDDIRERMAAGGRNGLSCADEPGWSGAIFNTWENGRTETTLHRDTLTKWLSKNGRPDCGGADINAESLIFYMGEVHGWRDVAQTTEAVEIVADNLATSDGAAVVIRHEPLPSYLVAVPLAPAFKPTEAASTQAAGVKMWGEVLETVEYSVSGRIVLTKAARDPAAMVTMPRRRPGVAPVAELIDGVPVNWSDLGVEESVAEKATTSKPTFESIKAMIDALPSKEETPDPSPVVEMIARLDNPVHRETLLEALKRKAGVSMPALRKDVRDRRRAAGEGLEEGVKVDQSGYRTLVHVGEPDHRQARAFLMKTMEKANAKEPVFSLSLGQVMGLRYHDGRAGFQPLTARQFQSALFKVCSFAQHRDGGDLTHRIPDGDVCAVVLEGVEPDELPLTPTIRRAPTMARNGKILDRNGWFGDVLVDLGDLVPPVVPLDPTSMDIAAARDLILTDMFGDFPFDDGDADGALGESEASRANAVGMVLTQFARDLFDGPSPLFTIVKPSPGVGGTLLAETAQRLFDGHASATTPNTRNEEEMQKHMVAASLGDDSFLFFDNVTEFNSETLKRSTTADRIGGRVLGLSKTVSRPNHFLWQITGINPRLGPEMARRAVFINLNSRVEDNSARNYQHADFKGWLCENRSRIIGAILTLIRAWWVKGAKPGKAKLASFESWSGVIGGILETAGIKGFLSNPRAPGADREGAQVKAFMSEWWKVWKEADTTEAKAFDYADRAGFVTGFGDDRRRSFGEMLDGLRGRVFDLDRDRVMFGVAENEGWRLVHLGKLERCDDADRS